MLYHDKQKGFTLIEMLVAIAIFAFVAAISYSSLNNALIIRERTSSFNQELSDLQLAIQIIDKDFRQIIKRPVRDPSGGDINRPAINLGGNDSIIEFTHTGWPNPLQQTRSELQRVAYLLEDEKIIRQYWTHLDRSSNREPTKIELLDKVDEINISALDKNDEAQKFWPATSTNSTELPKAIEVVILSQQWGEIRRIYEITQ